MPSTYRFVADLEGLVPLSLLELETLAKVLAAGGADKPRPFIIEAFKVTRGGPDTSFITTVFEPVAGGAPPGADLPFALAARLDTVFSDAPRTFTVPHVFGGSPVPDAPEELDSFSLGQLFPDGSYTPLFEATGLTPFTASAILAALSDTQGWYHGVFSLLDNATALDGTRLDDRLEVGAGDDTVRAGAGDDVVFRYKPGDLDYRGGPGHDVLDFSVDGPIGDHREPITERLDVNLGTGSGRSPYGGDLMLRSVEELRTTGEDDRVIGSRRADTVQDGFGGANVFRLKGGADAVVLNGFYEGTRIDGGRGFDTVDLTSNGGGGYDPERGFGRQVLDIANPARNIEDFEGVILERVEAVTVHMLRDYMHLDLAGSGADERLRVANFFARDNSEVRVRGRGGDDSLTGGFGLDTLIGGPGADRIEDLDGADVLRGGGGKDRLDGGPGDDLVKAGRGADTLIGGLGDNTLIGGGGDDIFIFADPQALDPGGHETSRIVRFRPGQDLLDFTAHDGIGARSDLDISRDGPDVLLRDGGALEIRILGLGPGDIGVDSFLFSTG